MRIITHNRVKNFIALIPVISLALLVLSTNYYYFFNSSYLKVYELISFTSGFSILSITPVFYMVYRYNFFLYSKLAVWGILVYILINLTYFFLGLFNIEIGFYAQVFEAFSITCFLTLSLVSMYRNFFKNE